MPKVVRIFRDDVLFDERNLVDLPVSGGRPQVLSGGFTGSPGAVFRSEFVVPSDAPIIIPDPPTNTTRPSISPTSAVVGDTLTRVPGVWSGGTVTWSWLVDFQEQQSGGDTFVAAAGTVVIREVATNLGGSTTADSAPLVIEDPDADPTPSAAGLVVVEGPTEGTQTATITAPSGWAGDPSVYLYTLFIEQASVPHDWDGTQIVFGNGITFDDAGVGPLQTESGDPLLTEAGEEITLEGDEVLRVLITFPAEFRGELAEHEITPQNTALVNGPTTPASLPVSGGGATVAPIAADTTITTTSTISAEGII